MKLFFVTILIICGHVSNAQLNCKTKQLPTGIETSCLHANGKTSTLETWDTDKRWGKLKAYTNSGKELFSYELRKVGGHASVYLSYHTNGQVKKAEYSSAPDGGIQFYNIISEYDEAGNQTRYTDLSQPDGRPRVPSLRQEEPVVYKQQVVKEGARTVTAFKIINATKYPVSVQLRTPPGSHYLPSKTTMLDVKPKQQIALDSIVLTDKFLKETEIYVLEVVKNQKKRKGIKSILASPVESVVRKEYTWYLLED
jgi:hypothetical protein